MNTRDQFGNYLLLKKLAEDPLGETFRAGRVGRQTLDRVVLLRVLNGAGFDPERIARALQARSPLAQALKSPTIGQATDVGQVRGVPYIAYDYSSGRSLSQLLEQAARRHQQLPLDHAVLIAERVALALAVAFETRLGDERVQHGFVTPHLVHVSNEGEVKLLGFEASTGLRESAAHPLIKQAASGYLSPETLAGQPLHKSDDVYSVAALLLEMLTGQAPAVNAANLRGAIVAAEGTPIPAELAALLERSLCPRDQRVPDIVSWHKSLAKLMADSGWAATTFNIAFFLHNLYRDEIDREARELETEKSQAAALVASSARTAELAPAAAAAPSAAPSAVRSTGPIREDTSVLRDEYGIPGKKRGASPALLGGIAAAVVVLGVGGYLLFGSGGSTTAAPATPPPAPVTEAAPAAAPAPTGMTPEQIQSMIQEALANQKKETEAEQRVSEEKLKALQKQQRTRHDSGRRRTGDDPGRTGDDCAEPGLHGEPAGDDGPLDAGPGSGAGEAGGPGARARPAGGQVGSGAVGARGRPRLDGPRRRGAARRPPAAAALSASRLAHEEGGDDHRPGADRRERSRDRRRRAVEQGRLRSRRGGGRPCPQLHLGGGEEGRHQGQDVDRAQGGVQALSGGDIALSGRFFRRASTKKGGQTPPFLVLPRLRPTF